VIQCEDGEAALRAFGEHTTDWVLLDTATVPLDGFTAAEELRAQPPNARIIFVTSHDQPRWRGIANRLGARGYALKDALETIDDIIAAAEPTNKPIKS
jgi:two-component system response regulator YesN